MCRFTLLPQSDRIPITGVPPDFTKTALWYKYKGVQGYHRLGRSDRFTKAKNTYGGICN